MRISEAAVTQVLGFLLPRLERRDSKSPFVVGLAGLQGSGKSTWASALTAALQNQHGLQVINVSLDDFYLDHDGLVRVGEEQKSNPLFKTRGQPGTHDEELAMEFFESLRTGKAVVEVPSFDKSKFNGEGDRVPRNQWRHVSNQPPVDIIIFEGWCVGFQAITPDQVRQKWEQAREQSQSEPSTAESQMPIRTIGNLKLEHLLVVNSKLRVYNETLMGPKCFDFFIHLDTDDLRNVYRWRIDQEHALRRDKGEGMTDAAVIAFVEGYMPGYELYLDRLRSEHFGRDGLGENHLRVRLGADRSVLDMTTI